MERQRQAGCGIEVKEPQDEATRRCFRASRLEKGTGGVDEALVEDDGEVIIRPTHLGELTEVDELADKLLQPLIDRFDDVAVAPSSEMRAGQGAFQREIVDARVKDHGWKTPSTQGTWIASDWTTIGRSDR